MNMHREYQAFAALDWAEEKHAWALVTAKDPGAKPERGWVVNTPERLDEWVHQLHSRFPDGPIAVALEQRRGPLIAILSKYPYLVLYPIHPGSSAAFRKCMAPSGAKSDPADAGLLLEFLLKHSASLSPLQLDTAETRLLQELTQERRRWVDEKTRLNLRLQQALKGFFPQMLAWFEDVTTPLVADWLKRWPTLQQLKTARSSTVRQFLNTHGCRSEELISERLGAIAAAVPATSDIAALETGSLTVACLLPVIAIVRANILRLEQRIKQVAEAHPDFFIIRSFPAAGEALAPRLLAALGTDRNRFASPSDLQCYTGIAPITEGSGKQRWIHFRWACCKFVRQTLHEWAGHTIGHCDWAHNFYRRQRDDQKKGHHAAVRALAFKWVRILFRCWKDRQPYDETRYLQAVAQRSQPRPRTPTIVLKKCGHFKCLAGILA